MSPRQVRFPRERVLERAMELVRLQGLENLSARGVADFLGASVAPVYNTFHSMESLTRAVLEAIAGLLHEYTRREFTNMPFLNIGVGMVVFARDEPALYRAFFHVRHEHADLIDDFLEGILTEMQRDPWLNRLGEDSLRRLLRNIRYYTQGLATAMIAGWIDDTATESVIRELRNMGHMLIFSEAAGISDCSSENSQREWSRLVAEQGLDVWGATCPGDSGSTGKDD